MDRGVMDRLGLVTEASVPVADSAPVPTLPTALVTTGPRSLEPEREGRPPATGRVYGFSAAVAALGWIFTAASPHAPIRAQVTGLTPWEMTAVLAAVFALCELVPAHLELRRETISFSLSLIPVVFGLYALGPWGLAAARVTGSALVLVAHRRQPVVKLAVNLGGFWLETSVAVFVFRTLSTGGAVEPGTWVAAFAATSTGASVFALVLGAAIRLYQGRREGALLVSLVTVVGVSVIETSLGVIAITLAVTEPMALLPLAVVTALVLVSYRTHRSFRDQHRDLEQLYDFSGALGDALLTGHVLPALLSQAAELMHAEAAWLVLPDGAGARQISLPSSGGSAASVVVTLRPDLRHVHDAAHCAGRPVLCPSAVGEAAVALDRRDLLAAPLIGSSGPIGTLVVADRSGLVRPFSHADLRRMSTVAGHASVAIEHSRLVERLREQAAESEHQSLHDPLTQLPNRTLFARRLEKALAREAQVAVLLLDLDRFKDVNDTLGHDNGDALLQQVGVRLRDALRAGDLVARLGGDEFGVLLSAITSEDVAIEVGRSIVELLEQPFLIGDMSVDVGASIGIAIASDATDPGAVLRRADVAMYSAKSQQTGVEVYQPDHDSYSTERLTLVADLRQAIGERALDIWFQPQVKLDDGSVFGVEALVRWDHPTRGRLLPDEFIAMAEQTGLIGPLTDLVLDESLARCKELREIAADLRVSVNLSARGLLRPGLVERVGGLLGRHGLPASALCLEITESSVMSDPRRTVAVLEDLAGLGVVIAVDDFGTGHSSLTYLKRLPVGEIKIDKSFVLAMLEDQSDEAIVRSVIDLARNLGIPVVAEGVEDELTGQRLRQFGCQQAQGYHFGRPMPLAELRARLAGRASVADNGAVLLRLSTSRRSAS